MILIKWKQQKRQLASHPLVSEQTQYGSLDFHLAHLSLMKCMYNIQILSKVLDSSQVGHTGEEWKVIWLQKRTTQE